MQDLAFTAIDFETANGFRGSPCAVGLTKVRGGRVVEEAAWLMRPPAGHDHFDFRNVRIHGIEAEMVASAPRFGELFAEIGAFIGEDILVAHNAAFDLGVIRSALEVSDLPGPAYDYTCTVQHSRRTYTLASHSLPFAAEAAGVPLVNHHDAAEDARACAGIMIDVVRRAGCASLAEYFATTNLRASHMPAYRPGIDEMSRPTRDILARGTVPPAPRWPQEGENTAPNPDADPGHPLYGRSIVFTGELAMPRQTAKDLAAGVGARPASSVTRSTGVLVVGDGFDAAELRSGRLTGKARRALDLMEQGRDIMVLSEVQFLQMLEARLPA